VGGVYSENKCVQHMLKHTCATAFVLHINILTTENELLLYLRSLCGRERKPLS